MPDQFGNPTPEEIAALRAQGGGAGLGFSQLQQAGLTGREAATGSLGFSGAFGGGRAQDFRSQFLTPGQQSAFGADQSPGKHSNRTQ